uniref:Large ribosomal subunit protein uL22c n=1 Tax=Mesotaenium endlicherianum TaxID=184485 RepID=A0A024B4T8_9VIRI|nr:ribosomal protein L22 [Mesotaenium endlicherianum]AHZ11206.1 ribosomal protein L22 [Mesotaenium endlicherianum]
MKKDVLLFEAQAVAKRVRMSPHKVRRVINQLRGCSYEQALMLLEFMPYKACYPVLQVLSSAAANASQNFGMMKSKLYVSGAQVNQGPVLKRFRPRAQGRGFPIRKPTCSIAIAVRESA